MDVGSFSNVSVLGITDLNLRLFDFFILVFVFFLLLHYFTRYKDVYINEFVRKLMLFWFNVFMVIEFGLYTFFFLRFDFFYSLFLSSVFIVLLSFFEFLMSNQLHIHRVHKTSHKRKYEKRLSKQRSDSMFYLMEKLKKTIFFYGQTKNVAKIKEELTLVDLVLNKLYQWFDYRLEENYDPEVFKQIDSDLKLYVYKLINDEKFVKFSKDDEIVNSFREYLQTLYHIL